MCPSPKLEPALRLRLHGVAAVWRAGGAQQPLERKQAALLAWLRIEGPTPRARMASLLWPEVDGERARANLRQRPGNRAARRPARGRRGSAAEWTAPPT